MLLWWLILRGRACCGSVFLGAQSGSCTFVIVDYVSNYTVSVDTLLYMNKFKGFLYGMTASATFGLLPLFTLPMMAEGMKTDSILCYRMMFASLLVAVLMKVRGVSFAVGLRELKWLVFLGFFYYGSAALLFQGYGSMSSGMATTLHFLYPVGVTLIMALLFKQRPSPFTIFAIILALSGVALLSLRGGGTGDASLMGIVLVLLSGLSYAIYLVTVNNVRRIREMDNLKLTLYVLLSGAGFFLVDATLSGGVQAIPSTSSLTNLLLMACLPTLVSNLALVRAIKSIGSTLTSVLGAMEPLTAIVIGVVVFGERVSVTMALGILLIISAVTLIVLSPLLDKNIADRLRRLAQRPIGRK